MSVKPRLLNSIKKDVKIVPIKKLITSKNLLLVII
jgi:hypothetical protein